MSDDPKSLASRRDFIRNGAASIGALTALGILSPEGQAANKRDDSCEDPAPINSQWQFKDPDILLALQERRLNIDLGGTWSVTALPLEVQGKSGYVTFTHNAAERLEARVPGEIHLDLMRVGRMRDPNVSDNARARCRWPEQHSWWYRTEFRVPADFRQYLRQSLVFEGIDLFGQIFVNGILAGVTQNAFSVLECDVKTLLVDGLNELVVRVTSGMEFMPKKERVAGAEANNVYAVRTDRPARAFLRKAEYSAYGKDWCDPLPNIGIWRSVRLEGRTGVVFHHLRLDTVVRGQEVALEGEVILENLNPRSEVLCTVELRMEPPSGGTIVQYVDTAAQAGRFSLPCRVVVPDAQLWWPNGMGAQPLYHLTARILCEGEETDRHVQTIGLRTISLDRSPLPEGSRFRIKVNGQPVYCKGANWAPADLIPARVDAERYQMLVAEARNAHFTMLRVNGAGLYESDEFYDACDRAGILVWQDFMFSVVAYTDEDPEFMSRVSKEAEDVVRRLRHHPSLALWCGSNECLWWSPGGTIFGKTLPDVCRIYDPLRSYWPGSPFGGPKPNSKTSGDFHWWNEGDTDNFFTPEDLRMSELEADRCTARFVSEYGALGPPHMASIQEFLKPNEISFDSLAWKIHTNEINTVPNGGVLRGIRDHYGGTERLSIAQFVLYGQMFQAQIQGRVVEAFRFRKDDERDPCGGNLIWSYNDAWGETGWSIIDHYARRKASYYWFRRGAAPTKVLVRSRDGFLITRVVNDTLDKLQATIRSGWMRIDGAAHELKQHAAEIPVNGTVEIAKEPIPSTAERDPREWLYAAILRGKGIPDDQAIWMLAVHRELDLPNPVIVTAVRNGFLEVTSSVYCHGVHLDDDGHEVLADNYFDLLPGIPLRIPISEATPSGEYPLRAILPIV
jgi:beta-mannosidase